jgi:WD40 repeat protein
MYGLAFDPGGRFLAVGSSEAIVLLEVATGKKARSFALDDDALTDSLAFSPDRKTLATGHRDGTARVWDVRTGKERLHFKADKIGPVYVALSPDGGVLATAGSEREPVIRLWDAAKGGQVGQFRGLGAGFTGVAFSPDGKTLAARESTRDVKVRLWEVATGKERLQSRAGQPYGHSLAFSQDGKALAWGAFWGAPVTLLALDAEPGKEAHQIVGHAGGTFEVAFSPDGKRLVSVGEDTTGLVWDVERILGPVRARPQRLSSERLRGLWDDLASEDAMRAYRAIRLLTAVPEQSVPFLREHLRPARPIDEATARLIAMLDSSAFRERERATRELARRGAAVERALHQALGGPLSLEVRRRVEELLRKRGERHLPSDLLRDLRGVEVLEHAATADARRLLEALSRGAPGDPLTREARAALGRLKRPGA